MAVAERQDALVSVGVARMIVEAQLDALAVHPARELFGMRDERAPVIAAVPPVVVPREIEHQGVERNEVLAQPRDLILEVPLVVAFEVRLPGLLGIGKYSKLRSVTMGPRTYRGIIGIGPHNCAYSRNTFW